MKGSGGAIVGSPADVVLVRMQADGKAPPELRNNYKNAFDGLYKIAKNEGILNWFRVTISKMMLILLRDVVLMSTELRLCLLGNWLLMTKQRSFFYRQSTSKTIL